ncbi:toxin-antitoxin system YwqK family antitoxin [Sebaldella sp. S0638]|uniref:toxin-antitoxin system YwqK family antitoxin n=1 Tax=Sebaldella sp. S0638 TaxID=2957809 RepID=UPI00209EFAAD|nr:hypothetical protein [Sebaldella sp. S0638]MCP1226068.1 hypothetical protein [Sebaldella sp. S0638]
MKILIYFCISILLISSTEVDFFDIKLEKGKNKKRIYTSEGKVLNGNVSIINFPEELSIASKEGNNISSLCDTENINMTKISKIDVEFEEGYPMQNIKCYNRKDILFYESEVVSSDTFEISKYDINGVLDQRKIYKGASVEYTSYYDNGQILREGNFKNNRKDGIWKEYYKDGKLKSVTEFKKDKIVNIVKY